MSMELRGSMERRQDITVASREILLVCRNLTLVCLGSTIQRLNPSRSKGKNNNGREPDIGDAIK